MCSLIFCPLVTIGGAIPARSQTQAPERGLLGIDRSDDALASMVNTERAFSALSVERGMRDAFIHFMADDGLLFQPLPVNGKEVWTARAPVPATLIWEPSLAEMAFAGDLGWSTGPWEYRPPKDSTGAEPPHEKIAHGHFISVWALQPDGQWRVAMDKGITHGRPKRGLDSVEFKPRPAHTWLAGTNGHKARANLESSDKQFARDVMKQGGAAFDTWAAQDLRFNREGEFPAEGRAAARAAFEKAPAVVQLKPQGARVSSSDDLGYSYGTLDRVSPKGGKPTQNTYMHVWRKEADGKWRLAVIVENPIPAR